MPPAPPRRTTSLLPPPSSSGLPSSGSHRAQLLGGFDASLMLHDHPMKAIGGVLCASGGEPLPVGSRDLGFHELPPSADRTSRVGSTQPIRLVPHRMFAAAPPSSARRAAIGSRRHVHRHRYVGTIRNPTLSPPVPACYGVPVGSYCLAGVMSVTGRSQWASSISKRRCSSRL